MDPKLWEEMKADPKEEDTFLRHDCVCISQPCQDLLPGVYSQEGPVQQAQTHQSITHLAMSPGYLSILRSSMSLLRTSKVKGECSRMVSSILGNLLLTPFQNLCHDFYSGSYAKAFL